MSIDQLQEKIRKTRNPSMVDFGILPELLPAHLLEGQKNHARAYGCFC